MNHETFSIHFGTWTADPLVKQAQDAIEAHTAGLIAHWRGDRFAPLPEEDEIYGWEYEAPLSAAGDVFAALDSAGLIGKCLMVLVDEDIPEERWRTLQAAMDPFPGLIMETRSID